MKLLLLLLLLLPLPATSQSRQPTDTNTVKEKLAYFLRLTDTLRQQARNPGMAMAIIWEGKVLYQEGMGYRDVARKLPVTTNTLFEIGSCSKAFTGVLAAQLVQDSLLRWNVPVRRYLPEFQLADEYATQHATLQDLLTHRVGLYQHYYLLYGPSISRNQLLTKLPHLSFNGSFREKFLYNNFLYTVVGLLEERVTHTPWEQLVASRIFQPLGMQHSFATFADFQRYPENTVSYQKDGQTIVPTMSIDAVAPAGGISSTIADMARWVKMLVNQGTLDEQLFLTPQQFAYLTSALTVRNATEEICYGIGWDIDPKRRIIYHDGRTAGQSCRILLKPEQHFGIVILSNQQSDLQNLLIRYATNILVDNNYQRLTDFEQFVLREVRMSNRSPASAIFPLLDSAVARETPRYVGTYTHPVYGRITLSQPQPNILTFTYYGFKGPVQSRGGDNFSAFTSHATGRDVFNFHLVKKARHGVKGLEITFPYSQPLFFTKDAIRSRYPSSRANRTG